MTLEEIQKEMCRKQNQAMEGISERLDLWMKEHMITSPQLARLLHYGDNFVYRWRHGKSDPPLMAMVGIFIAYHFSAQEIRWMLLGDSDDDDPVHVGYSDEQMGREK